MKVRASGGGLLLRKGRVISGIFLICAAAVFAFVIYPRHIADKQKTYPVISAARYITEGSVILDSDLCLTETPDASLAKMLFAGKNEVIGKIATRGISQGEYLFTRDAASDHIPKTVYNTLPEGCMVISIGVTSLAQAAAGQLRADDIVRIYTLREDGSAYTPAELQYVKILAVYDRSGRETGRDLSASGASSRSGILEAVSSGAKDPQGGSRASAGGAENQNESEIPAVISLLVNQEQALRIVELESRARYYFSLVSRDNSEKAEELLGIQRKEMRGMEGGRSR